LLIVAHGLLLTNRARRARVAEQEERVGCRARRRVSTAPALALPRYATSLFYTLIGLFWAAAPASHMVAVAVVVCARAPVDLRGLVVDHGLDGRRNGLHQI
jgi:hypothetical protein